MPDKLHDHGTPKELRLLPYDVITHIISYLYSDNRSLRQCAEVSRAWLWPARIHLFHHIHISNGIVWDKLTSTLETAPGIGSLVRIFSVSDLKCFLFDALYRDEVVRNALTAIEDLRISNVEPGYSLDVASDALGAAARRLTLRRVNFKAVQDLFRVISVRPRLIHVFLYEIRQIMIDDTPGAVLETSQLQTIVLDAYGLKVIMNSEGVKLNIQPKMIIAQSIADDDIPSLARLLEQIGTQVTGFFIDMRTEAAEASWSETLTQNAFLSHLPCLRKLVIENPAASIFRLAPVLHGVLIGVQSPYIEAITINIQVRSKRELSMKPSDEVLSNFPFLAELNKLLDEPPFNTLKTFHLHVRFETGQRKANKSWKYDMTEESDLIIGVKELFPRLHTRGLLSWTFAFYSEPEENLKYIGM